MPALVGDAERSAQSIPGTDRKASALAAVSEALAAVDPAHAERLAQSISAAPWRATALAAVRPGAALGLARYPFTGCRTWRQLMAGSGGSHGFPAMALLMASSVVMPWAAAVAGLDDPPVQRER